MHLTGIPGIFFGIFRLRVPSFLSSNSGLGDSEGCRKVNVGLSFVKLLLAIPESNFREEVHKTKISKQDVHSCRYAQADNRKRHGALLVPHPESGAMRSSL